MDGLIWQVVICLVLLVILFVALAFVAYIHGSRGIASFSMLIARWLFIIFMAIVVVVFLFGGRLVFLQAPLLWG